VGEFAVRKNEILEMYKNKQYDETIDKCVKLIGNTDIDDFDKFEELSFYNNIIFNCYFKQSKEEECKQFLKECVKYATTDADTYKAFHNQIRLALNTGKAHEVLDRIEENLRYYKSIDKTVSIADTLVFKGRATKDINCFKAALKLYKMAPEDTTYEEEIATKQMKELRHLS
jgi:tetratricopeptide (TPR) repeat protein